MIKNIRAIRAIFYLVLCAEWIVVLLLFYSLWKNLAAPQKPAVTYSLKDNVTIVGNGNLEATQPQKSPRTESARRKSQPQPPSLRLEPSLNYYYEPNPHTYFAPHMVHCASSPINSDTLNEARDYSEQKSSGVFRIVTLGDSWTFGLCVESSENFSKRLEHRLNQASNYKKFEVINLGVPGYDVQFSIERYRRRGKKYSPDLVLWLLKNDDFMTVRDRIHARARGLADELKISSPSLLKSDSAYPYRTALTELQENYGTTNIIQFNKNLADGFLRTLEPNIVLLSLAEDTFREIEAVREELARNHGKVYLHKIPTVYEDDELNLIRHGHTHPSAMGHDVIAGGIYDFLVETGLVRCEK